MSTATPKIDEFRSALTANARSYDVELSDDALGRLSDYYELLLAWNSRLHLVAPCSPSEFATRHVLESLLLLPQLPTNARIADIGSGAGLPIIPNLILRADVHSTMIEAAKKKAVFLREALRASKTANQAAVLAERFESLPVPAVDYLTCRALDRFSQLFPTLLGWSPPDSVLLLFGGDSLRQQIERAELRYSALPAPNSERRFLFICQKRMNTAID